MLKVLNMLGGGDGEILSDDSKIMVSYDHTNDADESGTEDHQG